MKHQFTASICFVLAIAVLGRTAFPQADRSNPSPASPSQTQISPSVPPGWRPDSSRTARHAYHAAPPTRPLPPTLHPAQFKDDGGAVLAYSLAAEIRELLYQVPCYCPCDKIANHQSLLDCFRGKHAAQCTQCKKEAIFCYAQWKKGKNAAEIRDLLAKGEFWSVDLSSDPSSSSRSKE